MPQSNPRDEFLLCANESRNHQRLARDDQHAKHGGVPAQPTTALRVSVTLSVPLSLSGVDWLLLIFSDSCYPSVSLSLSSGDWCALGALPVCFLLAASDADCSRASKQYYAGHRLGWPADGESTCQELPHGEHLHLCLGLGG